MEFERGERQNRYTYRYRSTGSVFGPVVGTKSEQVDSIGYLVVQDSKEGGVGERVKGLSSVIVESGPNDNVRGLVSKDTGKTSTMVR